jgi:hypothetical protein
MKKVHVASNETAPLVFPFGADCPGQGKVQSTTLVAVGVPSLPSLACT